MQRLIHEVTDLTLEENADEGILRHALPDGRSVPRHPAEFLATLWIRFGRLITGDNWAPSLVCFAHEKPRSIMNLRNQSSFFCQPAMTSGLLGSTPSRAEAS